MMGEGKNLAPPPLAAGYCDSYLSIMGFVSKYEDEREKLLEADRKRAPATARPSIADLPGTGRRFPLENVDDAILKLTRNLKILESHRGKHPVGIGRLVNHAIEEDRLIAKLHQSMKQLAHCLPKGDISRVRLERHLSMVGKL
jgi:hypothetical protein